MQVPNVKQTIELEISGRPLKIEITDGDRGKIKVTLVEIHEHDYDYGRKTRLSYEERTILEIKPNKDGLLDILEYSDLASYEPNSINEVSYK